MRKIVLVSCLCALVLVAGCHHQLEITNADQYFAPPSPPLAKPIKLGITSSSVADPVKSRYVNAIVEAFQRTASLERVIYPYNQASHQGQADKVVDIAVNAKYDGSGVNFWINWPGFLIFAPAIWGYKYEAAIDTQVSITDMATNASKQIAIPTQYIFRHADMGRTWTEVSWFEVSIIALIGGIVFTGYDNDVTPEFIKSVSHDYGAYVSNKIITAF